MQRQPRNVFSSSLSAFLADRDQNKGMGTGRLGPWNSSRRWPVPRSWTVAYWSGVGARECEQKPRKGKEQGAAMGPTNLDVTADAAHLSVSVCLSVCPFISGGQ